MSDTRSKLIESALVVLDDESRSKYQARFGPEASRLHGRVIPTCEYRPLAMHSYPTRHEAFVAGVAAIIDLSGSTPVRFRPCDSDYDALAGDWRTVGQDFQAAARELARVLLREANKDEGQEALFDADEFVSST